MKAPLLKLSAHVNYIHLPFVCNILPIQDRLLNVNLNNHSLMKIIGLHGGALLGVAYRASRRISPTTASAISTISTMPMFGFGASGPHSSFDDPFANKSSEAAPQNYQLYRCLLGL
jgi:hypothetical protein